MNHRAPESQASISQGLSLQLLHGDHQTMQRFCAETTHASRRLWRPLESRLPVSPTHALRQAPARRQHLPGPCAEAGAAPVDRGDECQESDLSAPRSWAWGENSFLPLPAAAVLWGLAPLGPLLISSHSLLRPHRGGELPPGPDGQPPWPRARPGPVRARVSPPCTCFPRVSFPSPTRPGSSWSEINTEQGQVKMRP